MGWCSVYLDSFMWVVPSTGKTMRDAERLRASYGLAQHAPAIAIPSSECQRQCGNVEIHYPFGIGDNCSLERDFAVSCEVEDGISKPFIGDHFELLNISLTESTIRVLNFIASYCYNPSTGNMEPGGVAGLDASDSPYRFSDVHNKFTVIGCNTLAYISSSNNTGYQSGCVSTCSRMSDLTDGSCSGMGCCQTEIPKGMDYYSADFERGFNTNMSRIISRFSRCSYAVLMEAAAFNFSTAYITTTKFNDTGAGRVPMVIDWAIRNGTASCEVAKRNETGTYACLSSNSECVDSVNGPGYVCNCSHGYQGNAYLPDGCKGLIVAFFILIIFSFSGYLIFQKKKLNKVKQEYFSQHGGLLLFEKMKSERGISFTVFTEAELIYATDNYDKSRIIGKGGNGTVYKVADFGASILAPSDEGQYVTMVQGTCGYLDPEYMQTCQLTDKSDVYSFGVILLEVLTGQVPLKLDGPETQRSLSSHFLFAMKENNLNVLLSSEVKGQESSEMIRGLAELAKQCLDMCGINRPTMKEVADEISRLRKLSLHPWVQVTDTESEGLLDGAASTTGFEIDVATTTGYPMQEGDKYVPMDPRNFYYAR
ncbi:hypothetical protein PR202_gb15008 [Eleusine coracana subsp. coracana]|uniref:Protein kinase domain-containing protein n=1 Tax=Eleusine coracana subsp. coracana TaxID=191504 RepID=A0AAV5EXW5_ELECO|nr:hypothetical protein PR202_gb15008 [Eleusine coracana subsp. coracana]